MTDHTAAKGRYGARKVGMAALLAAVALLGAGIVFWRATKATPIAAVSKAARTLAPEESPQATREQRATWMRARTAFFDEHLATQPRDAAWAGPLEAKIVETTSQQASLGVTFVGAKCLTKVCRAEFSYPGKEQRLAHIQSLGRAYPELPTAIFSYPGGPDDHTRLVVYLAKDNTSLPPFDFSAYKAKGGVPGPEQNAVQAAMK